MDSDQSVTMTQKEWNQLVAIVANATGWPVINKFFQQIQLGQAIKPNGLDEAEPVLSERLVPRRPRPD